MKLFLRSCSSLLLIHSRKVAVSYKRKYVHELLVNCLFKPAHDRPTMTIAVDSGRKATKQTNKQHVCFYGALCSFRFNLISNMTTFRKIYGLTFLPHPCVDDVSVCKIFATRAVQK